jgi:hypothetical protein
MRYAIILIISKITHKPYIHNKPIGKIQIMNSQIKQTLIKTKMKI